MKAPTIAPPVNEIVALHAEILGMAQTCVEKAIRLGGLLTEAKASLKHGQWLPWLKANVPFSSETAARYMRVHARKDELKSVTVTNLTDAYRMLTEEGEFDYDAALEEAARLLREVASDTSWMKELSFDQLLEVQKIAEECELYAHQIRVDAMTSMGELINDGKIRRDG